MVSKTTAPSLLSNVDRQASKKKSMLASVEPVKQTRGAANAGGAANHSRILWMSLAVMSALIVYYVYQSTLKMQTPHIDYPQKQKPVVSEVPHGQASILAQTDKAAMQGALVGTEPVDSAANIIDMPENNEAGTDDASNVQTAFASLGANEELVELDKTIADKPLESAAAKPAVKTQTKHQAAKSVAKTSKPIVQKNPAVKTKVNQGDVAVIKALLDNDKVPDTSVAANSPQAAAASLMGTKAYATEQAATKEARLKEERLDEMIRQKEQANGAMDISGMTDQSYDQAALEMHKCSTLNFIEKPLCEWKVCDAYKGKSPLCPSTAKQTSATPASGNQLHEQAKSMVAGQAEKSATQKLTEQTSTITGKK